ncbi:MAG: MOSC domain-containing protein [Candidatus Eremiobacteraeota bacterium]|nr:MOSC domain-containing protein [Candidatus Eremiobacteraeota bacterium]
MPQIGTLERIWRYPVKSLRGVALEEAEVAEDGLTGDRSSALFITGGHARAGKTLRGKEHDRLHLLDDAEIAVADAAGRGIATETRSDEPRYFDDAPVSLIVDRWLDGLSAHVGYAVEPSRFRPNFFVRAVAGFEGDESALAGATIALGDVRLRVRYGIERCVAITYHPDGEPADQRILRYVAAERATLMGVYCDVVRAGRARAGDPVFVEA